MQLQLTENERETVKRVLNNQYIPHVPTQKQWEFLLDNSKELLYGGAAGGGKSDALLMGALMYVDVSNYSALILRKTTQDLKEPDALIPRSHEWLGTTDANYNAQDKQWAFPSGAVLSFGYLEYEKHKYRYQSSAFQYIGFDELTQFKETQYRYLLSRLRRLTDVEIPVRMRGASNPGNVGHDWVNDRFVQGEKQFISATLEDNPHLDTEDYKEQLMNLNPIDRQRLLEGDWSAVDSGDKFQREWFQVEDEVPNSFDRVVRYWDLAATSENESTDPDWTAGCKMGVKDDMYYILDIRRLRESSYQVEDTIKNTAKVDGEDVEIFIEQEPGASGKSLVNYYKTKVLPRYSVKRDKPTGKKEIRANPVASQAEAGNVILKRANWNQEFLDEVGAFPNGSHDDQVDSVSGAFDQLAKEKKQARVF